MSSRPGDIPIPETKTTGLPIPSVIRTATIDALRAEFRGEVPADTLDAVRGELKPRLGL